MASDGIGEDGDQVTCEAAAANCGGRNVVRVSLAQPEVVMSLMRARVALAAAWHAFLRLLAAGALAILIGPSASAEQTGKCSSYDVAVFYEDASELDAACRAIRDVVGYFQRIDVDVSSKVSVHFANRASNGSVGHSPAHGLFDPLQSRIVIYRASDARP